MDLRFQQRPSLEALFAWGFGSLVTGAVLTAILTFTIWRVAATGFDEYEAKDAPIAAQASRGVDSWLRARRYEEQFMSSPPDAPGAAQARYFPLWERGMHDIGAYLAQIRHTGDQTDQSVVDLVPALEAEIGRYRASFAAAVGAKVRLGDSTSGLEGEMRAAGRAIEALIAQEKKSALEESFLKLSHIRMDYALTRQEQYVQAFSKEAQRLEELSDGLSRHRALVESARKYGEQFQDYVRTARELEARQRDFLAAAGLIEPGLERLEQAALDNTHGGLLSLESRITRITQFAAVIALLAAVLGALIAVLVSGRIRLAAQRVIGFAARLAAGRLETRLARMDSGEFGALESALNTMADRLQESDEFMSQQARALEASNRRIALLSEMTGLLQTAVDLDEAAKIGARHLEQMSLARGGALYLFNHERDHLHLMAGWGEVELARDFAPGDCWAMRRAQPYGTSEGSSAVVCAHADPAGGAPLYLCLPMTTQDGMLGLVHVVFGDPASVEEDSRFARRLSEQLGLALANLKLRETLKEQSLNDPLTGLFNRRFLEESIDRELARAAREKGSVAVLMVDADHFKRYNDAYGHEAGDEALRQLGRALKTSCRATDLACRYGGEEFTVVLPGTPRDGARIWAERLQATVRQMRMYLNGNELPGLTVSIGVALYPEHGDTSQAVLKAADLALYEAKHGGRDRTVILDGTVAAG